ncbi:MAG: ABC transporter permease, partial [Eudoraea sp.]|nr:ABC transporter permease [Eudoraea sp.]
MNDLHLKSNADFQWLLRMAWRDGKASGSRLLLFMASIILGIAALVSIQSFSDNLQNNIVLQSKALMGADYIIDSNNLPNERVQAIIDSLGPEGIEVSFASMASFPNKKGTRLSQIRGIEGGFPIYGELETSPVSAASDYQENSGALVDATIMIQFGLEVGDSVKIGQLTFPITGSLNSVPGSTALTSSVAPAIIIPYRHV